MIELVFFPLIESIVVVSGRILVATEEETCETWNLNLILMS